MNFQKLIGFSIIEIFVVILVVGIVAAVAIPAWNKRNDQTEVIKTKDWQCLKTEDREYEYPIVVGKIIVMQTGRREECVQWKRIGG